MTTKKEQKKEPNNNSKKSNPAKNEPAKVRLSREALEKKMPDFTKAAADGLVRLLREDGWTVYDFLLREPEASGKWPLPFMACARGDCCFSVCLCFSEAAGGAVSPSDKRLLHAADNAAANGVPFMKIWMRLE